MLTTLPRKERERLEREARILDLAREMLRTSGYLGLSMDRIADEIEYSKGTVYQHFRNKEEILLALANQALEKRVAMFERASAWSGETRMRMVAIGAAAECFVERYPQHFAVEQIVRSNSIWEKTSEERRDFLGSCEKKCMQILGGIVSDAVAHQDLVLPDGQRAEDLIFGLWSMSFGAYTIMSSSETLPDSGLQDPVAALHRNYNMLLDGYGWKPLSREVDYGAVLDQVKQELFSDE